MDKRGEEYYCHSVSRSSIPRSIVGQLNDVLYG
jgi:hypothetical protein